MQDATGIQAEMVAVLFRQAPPVFFGNYVVSGLFTLMLWRHADKTLLLAWMSAIFLLTCIRLAFTLYYLKKPSLPQHASRWGWLFAAMSGLSGILWGLISPLFLSPEDPSSVVLIGIVLAGMTGGSVASLSAFMPAYYAFAIPAVAPFAIHAFLIGSSLYSVLGTLALCLLAVNLYYSRVIWRTLRSFVELRFENLELIRQLQFEKERAESASQAKSHFLAAASHDLRQPVHALGLFASSLRLLGQQPQPKRELIESIANKIHASLNNLGKLLNNLLDVSRLDAGLMDVDTRPTSVQEIFSALENEFGPTARNKGLDLHIVRSQLWSETDPILLQRILSNIVANAIRYTDCGKVVIGCRRRGKTMEIQVSDTGIGIDEHQIPHIFREFYQVENVARPQEQGLGLGLAIVKRSAELIGAVIRVKSIPAKGTTFSILLPRCTAEETLPATLSELSKTPLPSLTILVIDNNQAVLDAARTLIASWGHHVLAAHEIAEAVSVAKHGNNRVDLILADYRLGGNVTGPDAISAVNAQLPTPAPAVIITGDTAPARIQEALASGFRLLHKPLAPDALLKLIEEVSTGLLSKRAEHLPDQAG